MPQFLQKSEARDHHRRQQAKPYIAQRAEQDTTNSTTGLRNYYMVPDHWDLTPETRQPLDHYVTDSFVGVAIYNSMQLENEKAYRTFAIRYPIDAASFFSGPPYSEVATEDFGYQNPHKLVLADDEDALVDGNHNDSNNTLGNNNRIHDSPKLDDYFGNISD